MAINKINAGHKSLGRSLKRARMQTGYRWPDLLDKRRQKGSANFWPGTEAVEEEEAEARGAEPLFVQTYAGSQEERTQCSPPGLVANFRLAKGGSELGEARIICQDVRNIVGVNKFLFSECQLQKMFKCRQDEEQRNKKKKKLQKKSKINARTLSCKSVHSICPSFRPFAYCAPN